MCLKTWSWQCGHAKTEEFCGCGQNKVVTIVQYIWEDCDLCKQAAALRTQKAALDAAKKA